MFDFPNAPSNGQIAIGPGGISYVWDNTKWASMAAAGIPYAPLASPVFTGDPQAPTPVSTDSDTSIATTAFVQAVAAPFGNNTGRNLVHNGRFDVAQRGNGGWTTTTYTMDRWLLVVSNDTSNVGRGANTAAIAGDEAAAWIASTSFTGNAAAGAVTRLAQPIEDVRRLSNKTVTVSFYAIASAALKLGVSLDQYFGSGGSPSATVQGAGQSVTLTTGWARYSLTFTLPSVTAKTIGTNNDHSTYLNFWYSSGATNNPFAGGIGVQSGTINIWGVQLEIGSTATPLAKRDPADELALAQRFYQSGYAAMACNCNGSVNFNYTVAFVTQFRASATMVISGQTYTNAQSAGIAYNDSKQFTPYATAQATGFSAFTFNWTASADL